MADESADPLENEQVDEEASAAPPREPRPLIVIPRTTRLAIGAVVIVIGLLMLIAGESLLKVIGVVLIAGGVFDIVVGQRQRV